MKIYYVVSRFPYPLYKGDKLRAFHQIKELSKNHEVYLAALSDQPVEQEAINALRPFCKDIQIYRLGTPGIIWRLFKSLFFSKKPLQVAYFYHQGHGRKIQHEISHIRPDQVFCQLVRTAEYGRMLKQVPTTLDYMDALSAGMYRRAEQSSGWFKKQIFRMEARRLKRYEHEILKEFDHSCIISKSDRDLIFHYEHEDIAIIPNGVDQEYYSAVSAAIKYDLLFTGNMSYPPNVSSVRFLVDSILPLIRKEIPNIRLLIAGADPSVQIRKLQSDTITVLGWTNDIREAYNSSRIFIAPMLIGSGLQNKLLEAMSMKLPCITSELANRSLGANEGEHILVGHSPEEFAQLVVTLMKDQQKAMELGEKGHSFVTSNYNWTRSNELLINLMEHGRTADRH